MEYNRIIAITGLPGLFEMISSKTDGAIVRSLEDKSTKFVSSRVHNFSHLESIEIYTQRDNVNLVEIFQLMDKSSDALPDGKEADKVKAYFQKLVPEMDYDRVYISDMKKMVKWYDCLKKNNVALELGGQQESPEEEPVAVEEAKELVKPAKASKKKEAAEQEAGAEKKAAEKPKKAAAKKKTQE